MKKRIAIVIALGAVTGMYLYAVGKQIKSALEATKVDTPEESSTDNDGRGGDEHTGCNCGGGDTDETTN